MVTHDVHLKGYAHRVIWMRDGKIMRVEHRKEEHRQKELKQLEKEYNDIMEGKQRERIQLQRMENTFLRRPSDYVTSVLYKKRGMSFLRHILR